MRRFFLSPTTLVTDSTTARFFPSTIWIPGTPFILARVQWEIFSVSGLATCAPAYQVATNIDAPGATQFLDPANAYNANADVYFPTDFRNMRVDATAPLKSNMLVRFGWLYKLSGAGSIATISAGGVVDALAQT